MNPTRPLLAVATIGALALSQSPAAFAAADAKVKTEKVIEVRVDAANMNDATGRDAFILKHVSENGSPASVMLTQLGGDGAQAIDIADLAVGETRSVQGVDGEWVDISRTDAGLELKVGERTIQLPALGGSDQFVAGLPGHDHTMMMGVTALDLGTWTDDQGSAHAVKVCKGAPGAQMIFLADGKNIQLGDETIDIDIDALTDGAHGVVIEKLMNKFTFDGASDGDATSFSWSSDDGDMKVLQGFTGMHGFPHVMGGMPSAINFDELESLKGLDEATRAKIIEELKGLTAPHAPMVIKIKTDADIHGDHAKDDPNATSRRFVVRSDDEERR